MAISKNILEVAQAVMDSYYQDFSADDNFFRIEDFAYWVSVVYSKDADEVAKEIYNKSGQDSGIGQITFNNEWWANKEFEIKSKDGELYIEMDISYLGFTYDSQNSGIQQIMPIGKQGNCGNFARTTLTELWQLSHIGTTKKVFWYLETQQKVVFVSKSDCEPKKVMVYYIPSPEDANFKLPKSREFQIATIAWSFMKQANQGVVIDMVNNSNQNKTIQTEIDQKQLQPLK